MVPKRLKEARMEAGLSQEKLSQLLGVAEGINTRSRFSSYEVGRTEPPFKLVKKSQNFLIILKIISIQKTMILQRLFLIFTENVRVQS